MTNPTYNRVWFWSKSNRTITGATLIVNGPNTISVTDSKSDQQFYSVQFQAVNIEGLFMQNLIQFQPPGKTIWQVGYGIITATTGFSLEQFPIQYPFALSFDFTLIGKMLASFTQFNQNMNVSRGPYTKELSVIEKSVGIRHLNFIAGGYGGGSLATFAKGSVFDFSLHTQGITDLTADGMQFLQGKGPPLINGTTNYPQTAEGSNLQYQIDSLTATNAKVRGYS